MTDVERLARAVYCLAYGRPREALSLLSELIAAHPDAPVVLRLIAQSNLALRRFHAAVVPARRAAELDPANVWGQRLVSTAASKIGEHVEARDAALEAIRLSAGQWLNHVQLASVDLESPRGVNDGTWDAVSEAIRLAPNDPRPLIFAARVARARGHLREAEVFYGQALRVDPGNPEARHLLIDIRSKSGHAGEATSAFLGLLDEDPRSVEVARSLRRTVLRTLEWVNGILLVALIAVGLLAVLAMSRGSDSPGGSELSIGDSLGEVVVVVLMLGGLWLAWSRYRRGLGDRAREFLSGLPTTSPSLVVLAAFQGVGLVALVALALLIAIPIGGIGLVAGIAGAIAFGTVFICLIYAGLLHAAF